MSNTLTKISDIEPFLTLGLRQISTLPTVRNDPNYDNMKSKHFALNKHLIPTERKYQLGVFLIAHILYILSH